MIYNIFKSLKENISGYIFFILLNLLKIKKHTFIKVGIHIEKLEPLCDNDEDRFSYQNKYIKFNITGADKVLDIGSGGYPFPLATHLADYYNDKTTHRFEKLVKDGRPFVNCNIEDLPFKDKEFDFVYCSHLLEHVDNPSKACRELMRVAKRGYIETPTRATDVLFNFIALKDHHKWYTQIINKTIIFMEWTDNERRDLNTNYFFDEYHSKWKNPFRDLIYNNRDLFTNMLLWENYFHFIVIDNNGSINSISERLRL